MLNFMLLWNTVACNKQGFLTFNNFKSVAFKQVIFRSFTRFKFGESKLVDKKEKVFLGKEVKIRPE